MFFLNNMDGTLETIKLHYVPLGRGNLSLFLCAYLSQSPCGMVPLKVSCLDLEVG